MTITRPPLITVEGSYREMGGRLGERTADLVGQSIDNYFHRFRADAGLSADDIVRWGRKFHDAARQYDPNIADMLEGLAEGAGRQPYEVGALNARTEIMYGREYGDGGCTSLSVLPRYTASGHTLLAQNWDWHPEQADVTFLLATRDASGFSVVSLTEAGMLAKSGLNSAGIGICFNALASDRDKAGDGVPMHVLLRGALQSMTMSKAHKRLLPIERISSGNVLIADAGGESINFELAPGMFGTLLPRDGLIAHANHFETGLPLHDFKATSSALTQLRAAHVRHLLEPALERHMVTVEDIANVLRDDYSHPDGLCRYPDPDVPESAKFCTVYSLIIDLDLRTMWIAPGPPSENSYTRIELDSIFDTDQAGLAVDLAPTTVGA
ncbi:C45 family peptidase [Saccharopolyspora mangrovi]|uniref:C45 family peptidase n=1 Tax=Saccharopolyspora mangrovi TaxID=3082379 RepID=A0ABU6AGJ2_9PSEU|nr:C45 family peptidase [Saccharopolyspora sp. S2-29]MEB3370514.1 C45 family peptidase [Saccharopolyspora sp. S2-29]